MVTRGKGGGGINREVGIDIYTLLHIKLITINIKNLLYSPGNSSQYSVMTYMGKNLKKSGYIQCIKTQRHHFAIKGPYSQSYDFSSSHVWVWEMDHKEVWALKNWCFWTAVLEKMLESPLDSKEIQSVHHKGNQFWIFTGRTDAEAEAPKLWPPDAKNRLIGEDLDSGKDWRREEADDRGWDGWMSSSTQWTGVWANSGR